jgi:hypothetical protein
MLAHIRRSMYKSVTRLLQFQILGEQQSDSALWREYCSPTTVTLPDATLLVLNTFSTTRTLEMTKTNDLCIDTHLLQLNELLHFYSDAT